MATEMVTLAPAAGSGIGKLIADSLLSQPDFVPLLTGAFMDALQAKSGYRDKATGEWIDIPDYKTRLSACMGILAHMEGEPIKRIIHQHLGGSGAVDPLAALQESPALREAARRLLEKSEWKTGGGKRAKERKAAKATHEDPVEV